MILTMTMKFIWMIVIVIIRVHPTILQGVQASLDDSFFEIFGFKNG